MRNYGNRKDQNEYFGPLGDVVRKESRFVASKDDIVIGTFETFREAILALMRDGAKPSRLSKYRVSSLVMNQYYERIAI
jgi:hypothetical protein